MRSIYVILLIAVGGCGKKEGDSSLGLTTSTTEPSTRTTTTTPITTTTSSSSSLSPDEVPDELDPIERVVTELKESPKADSVCSEVKGKGKLIAGVITRREMGYAVPISNDDLKSLGTDVLILCFTRIEAGLDIAREAANDPRETLVRVKMVSAFGSIISNGDALREMCPFVSQLDGELVGYALVQLYIAAAELANPAEARFGSNEDRDNWGRRLLNACGRH